MRRIRRTSFVVLTAVGLACASPAAAADYFVRSNGSDTNNGRSPATALASIRHAASKVLNPGDRVIVGPGTYVDGDIGPAHNGIANRPVVFLADTTGALTGDSPGIVLIQVPAERSTGFLLLGSKAVTIDGFSITGAIDACIQVRTATGGQSASDAIVVRNVEVYGCAKRGIDITAIGNVTVENSRVYDNSSGITVLGPGAAGSESQSVLGEPVVELRNNEVWQNATVGILLERVAGGIVADNMVADHGGSGIQVRTSNGLQIEGNFVEGNQDGGVVIGRGETDTLAVASIGIVDNRIEANRGSALAVVATGGVRIIGNQILQPFSSGIFVRGLGSAEVDIEENVLPPGPLDSILVEDVARVRIAGHTLLDSAENAILVRRAAVVEIVDNEVINPKVKAISVESDGDVSIRDNRVVGSRSSGLSVSGESGEANVVFAGNDVRGSLANGIFANFVQRVAITDNLIDGTGFVGINLTNVSDTTVSRNRVSGSPQDAVRVTGSGPVRGHDNVFTNNGDSGFLLEAENDKAFALDLAGNSITAHEHGIFVRGCSGGQIAGNSISGSNLDGILLRRCSGVAVVGNQINSSGRHGVSINSALEPAGRDFALRGNRIRFSNGPGVQIYARGNVVATRNEIRVSGSSGLSIETSGRARVMLSNNEISLGGSHGIFVSGASRGLLQNSVIHSHFDTGVTLRHSPNMLVANSLIYANRSDGLAIGTGNGPSPNAIVVSNTIYGNDGRGFVLGSGDNASPGATFMHNVIESNAGTGIAVDRQSSERFRSAFNMNSDGYGVDTPRNPFDLVGPAGYLAPAGADGRLGGVDDADDDFHLRQVRGGQASDGRAIDAGSADTDAVGLTGSTATNGVADIGRIDLGYHYGADLDQQIRVPDAFLPVYVRAGGDDTNDGKTPDRAFATIRRAALAGISGVTVVVGPGVYVESEPIRIRRGAEGVTFLADALGEYTGDPAGPVLVDAGGGETGFIVLEAADVTIDGFHVTNAATAGIQIRAGADRAIVRNNVVFSNARRAIEVRGADDVRIENNLVYANGTGGIQLQQTRGCEVLGNTVFGSGDNGITIGGGLSTNVGVLAAPLSAGSTAIPIQLASESTVRRFFLGDAVRFAGDPGYYRVLADVTSTLGLLTIFIDPPLGRDLALGTVVSDETLAAIETRVQRNIIAANAIGLQVRLNSMEGYQCGFNVIPEGMPVQLPLAGSTPRCDSDIIDDPAFVRPAGLDGVLGANGFVDDDFHLVQALSPAVDLIPCTDELPSLAGTTHPDGNADACPLDAGYHYPLPRFDAWAN